MKKPENRLKVKKLFILGAGASYAASLRKVPSNNTAPLDKDFCKRIKDIDALRPIWVNQLKSKILKNGQMKSHSNHLGLKKQ